MDNAPKDNNKENLNPASALREDFLLDLKHNISVDSLDGFAQVVDTKNESPMIDYSFGSALTARRSSASFDSPVVVSPRQTRTGSKPDEHEHEDQKPLTAAVAGVAEVAVAEATVADCGDSGERSNAQTAEGDTADPVPQLREAEQYADDLARELLNDTNQIVANSAKPVAVEEKTDASTTVTTSCQVVEDDNDKNDIELKSSEEETRKEERIDGTQNKNDNDLEADIVDLEEKANDLKGREVEESVDVQEEPPEQQQQPPPEERPEPEELQSDQAAEGNEKVSNLSAATTEVVDTQWDIANKNPEAYQTFQTAPGTSLLENEEEEDENVNETEKNEDGNILEQSKEMEFTKNYSDDLLTGQSDEAHAAGADLADFELPPYSGSSSGSEAPRQPSPGKRKSSASSSAAAQALNSQQVNTITTSTSSTSNLSPPDLTAVKNLLFASYSRVAHIFHWTKPIESGVFFAIGVVLIAALTFFSIISVVAYTALGTISASCLLRTYKALMKALNRSTETPFDHIWDKVLAINVSLSPEKIHEQLDASLGNFNASLAYLKQVLLVEDKLATFKFGLILYLLTYIGSWFNGMTLITISYLALFTVPIFYEKNKTKIDELVSMATGQASSTVSSVTNKVSALVFGSAPSSAGASKKQD